jgi:hypothetical protein
MQADKKRISQCQPVTTTTSNLTHSEPEKPVVEKKRKRETRHEDEIDVVFKQALGTKIKKGALRGHDITSQGEPRHEHERDEALSSILGAIRSAPKTRDTKTRR